MSNPGLYKIAAVSDSPKNASLQYQIGNGIRERLLGHGLLI